MSTCCNSSLAAWPDPRSPSVAGSIRYRCHQRHYYYPLPIFILITLYDRIFHETWTTWRNVRMMMMTMMRMTRIMTIRRATQDHSHGHVLLLNSGMLSFYCCSFTDHSFLYKYSLTELELQPSSCSGNSSNKNLHDAGEIVVEIHSLSLSQHPFACLTATKCWVWLFLAFMLPFFRTNEMLYRIKNYLQFGQYGIGVTSRCTSLIIISTNCLVIWPYEW